MAEDREENISGQDKNVKDGNEDSQNNDHFDRDKKNGDGEKPKDQKMDSDGDDFSEAVCNSEFKCGEKVQDRNPGSEYHIC
jgi:uncharacterized sporulation protein YeaH/YhbH (DUF444 family)